MKNLIKSLLVLFVMTISCYVFAAEEPATIAESSEPSLLEPSTTDIANNGNNVAAVYVDLSLGYAGVDWHGFDVGAFNVHFAGMTCFYCSSIPFSTNTPIIVFF